MASPGLTTSIAMEGLQQLGVVRGRVLVEFVQREGDRPDAEARTLPASTSAHVVIVFRAIHGLNFTMSPGLKKIMKSRR